MIFDKISINDLCYLTSPKEKGFSDCWTQSQYLSYFNSGRSFGIKAVKDNNIIGFIILSVGLDDADVELLYVEKEFRNLGIASELILTALDSLKDKEKIFLEVRESNIPAINLYKKFGFEEISTRKKYYSDGEDAIVLSRSK